MVIFYKFSYISAGFKINFFALVKDCSIREQFFLEESCIFLTNRILGINFMPNSSLTSFCACYFISFGTLCSCLKRKLSLKIISTFIISSSFPIRKFATADIETFIFFSYLDVFAMRYWDYCMKSIPFFSIRENIFEEEKNGSKKSWRKLGKHSYLHFWWGYFFIM